MQNGRTYTASLILLCCAALGWNTVPARATVEETVIVEPAAALDLPRENDTFTYRLEGRPDPFVPFITPKAATTKPLLNPDEIVDENVELTGMRQFEPGQLKLVAVQQSGKQRIAMVEDVTGKGYILRVGMPIGRRGVVSEIRPEQVLITETARTRAGKELVNTVVMRLNKEGE